MKKIILLIALGLMTGFTSQAFETQVNFDTHSGRFVLFVNGEKINHRPAQQLRLNHLPAGRNNLRIRYWNRGQVREVRKTIFLQPGYETSFLVKPNRYGDVVIAKTRSICMSGYTGQIVRRGNGEFRFLMEDLKNQRFDNRKLILAGRYIERNDLTTRQLIRIIRQFSFDNTKVDFILNAYDYLYDPENIHWVYDELRFRSSVKTIRHQLSLHPGDRFNNGRQNNGKGYGRYKNGK